MKNYQLKKSGMKKKEESMETIKAEMLKDSLVFQI